MIVSSGGTVNAVTVNSGGSLLVEHGGTALNIVENGGYTGIPEKDGQIGIFDDNVTFVPNSFSGVVLLHNTCTIHSGTTGYAMILSAPDPFQPDSVLQVYSGGMVVSATAGVQYEGKNPSAGMGHCAVYLASGALAEGVIVKGSATLVVSSGATATRTNLFPDIIRTGGNQLQSGVWSGQVIVSSGGVANSTHVSGGFVENGDSSHAGGLFLESGAVAKHTIVEGADIFVGSSGFAFVSSGALAYDNEILSGGRMTVFSGGTANSILVARSGTLMLSGGQATGPMTFESGAIVSAIGGAEINFDLTERKPSDAAQINDLSLVQGAPAYTISVSSNQNGGVYRLADGAAGFQETITVYADENAIGSAAVGRTLTFGYLSCTLQLSGSILSLAVNYTPTVSGGEVFSGLVIAPGDVRRGMLYVLSGGKAFDTVIQPGASMTVSSGGFADRTLVSGKLDAAAGYRPLRGTLWVDGGTASRTTLRYGMMQLQNGGHAADTEVVSGGLLQISGGAATGNTIGAGGSMTVVSGTASGNTVVSRGYAAVAQDGVLLDTELQTGGNLRISRGGAAENLAVQSGGKLLVSRGGVLRGELDFADGAVVSALAGAEIRFDLAGRSAGDDALIRNLTAVQGTPDLTITVAADQAAGVYRLAEGAADFARTVTIGSSDGDRGSLAVGGSILLAGTEYLLTLDGQSLLLTAADLTPPDAPVVSADITAVTNGDVTVTAVFSDDSAVCEYSLSGTSWTAYTDGIVFTENGTAYFRGTDAAGNVSEITRYTVSNIDKIPPVKPTVSANITQATDRDVTVTASFSADTVRKEYSSDGETWQNYAAGIVFTENGTAYFRGTDAAGNVSEVARYEVSNIDRVPPDAPVASADITETTNQSVTVTAVFSDDTVKKEYSLDNRSWRAYTGAVVMADNGTVWFRGTDAAGNVSETANYAVTNIDKTPAEPEPGVYGAADDLNADGRADVIMSITQSGHGAYGATGAWLIGEDQIPVWGDLSQRAENWEIFGTGRTAAGKATADVYVRSSDNVLGAWTTGDDGQVTGWETIGEFSSDTEIVGLGDFNGSGQTDLLLRNANGAVGCFFTNGEGWNYFQSLGDEWKLSAIGDLNGDGRDDVVLKHDAGFAGSWLTQADGTMAWADLDTLPEGFAIVGAGDFDGDGTDDVLLQKGSYFGAWLVQNGNAASWMGLGDLPDVTVEQIADFDGDGTDDLRVRTSAGDLGSQLVKGADTLEWKYYGSVGDEWSTSLAAL